MILLEFCDGMNLKRIKIKTERVIDIQGEDVREYSFHVINIITDSLRQEINIRGRTRVAPIENSIQEYAALQGEIAGIPRFR